MSAVVQRVLFSICLLVWGCFMLYYYTSGLIVHYLDKRFFTVVLVGGLACCVLGLFNLLTAKDETDCGHGGECHHDHEESDLNPVVALLLILMPLLLSLSWSKHKQSEQLEDLRSAQELDASTMSFLADLPPFTKETLDASRTKASDGSYQMELTELFYSAGSPELVKVFTDLDFETEGKLRDEPNRNPDGKRMRIYKMFMTCCAADMKAIPISIEFDGELPDFDKHTWVKVAGTMTYEHEKGVVYPVLKVKRIEETAAPYGEELYK